MPNGKPPWLYEEEPCFDCDGEGCETCNDTGTLYTERAIVAQLEEKDRLARERS